MSVPGLRVTVARIYRFRAIHSLPDFAEPWCHPHPHDYTVEVEIAGGTDTDELDAAWARFGLEDGADMDGRFLPDSTVERISAELLDRLGTCLGCDGGGCAACTGEGMSDVKVLAVTVWEDRQRWGRAARA